MDEPSTVFDQFSMEPGAGAGKSSLISLLLRLSEASSGQILIDGVDARSVPLRKLRGSIGLVPQHPFLFEASP